ncbi:MAG: hypothetical protein WB471_13985 [Nocardioides sp.]
MTTHEGADLASEQVGGDERPGRSTGRKRASSHNPTIWQRGHPVFVPLAGFFTGTLLVALVLGALGVGLKAWFDVDLSENPEPFFVAILALLVLNVLLLVAPVTRRFARYMLFGLLATPVVVAGVGAATLFLLVRNDG